jgi:hypothetical protein
MIRAQLTQRPKQLRFGGLIRIFFLIMLCLIPSLVQAEQRVWTSADGKNRVRGEIKGTNGKLVILEKSSDGKLHVIPLSMLSNGDQEFVRQKYPQIFAAGKDTPAQPSAFDLPKMPDTKAPEMNGPASDQFDWSHETKVVPQFKVMQLEGAAILNNKAELYTYKQQSDLRTSTSHIGALMIYLADRGGYEVLAQKMEEKGYEGAFNTTKGQELVRISECFRLFQAAYKLFYSKEEWRQYYELSQSKMNDFDKGVQVARVIRKFDQDFQKIKYDGEAIALAEFSPATLDNYQEARGEFPLRVRGSVKHLHLHSLMKEIYMNSPEMPSGIKKTPDEAREFARQIEGKKLAFRKDVLLTNLRFERTQGFLNLIHDDHRVNVQVIRLSLVDAADPSQVIQSWDVKPEIEKSMEPSAEENQDLAQKMQQLAKQHGLVMWKGYPVVRVDLVYSPDGSYLSSDHKRFTGLLDRVALGLNPKHASPIFLATHFPDTIGTLIHVNKDRSGGIRSADWLGTNDFDRRDILKRFEQTYTDKLRDYAIDLPIRFVQVHKVRLGFNQRYDFEREGVLIDHRVVNERFPGLTSGSFNNRDDKISGYSRPCYIQQFLPLKPDQARPLFSQAGPEGCVAYLSRLVTWDRIQLKNDDETTLPPVSVTTESIELYQDPMLKHQLATLEFKQLPPSILSEAKGKMLPGPDQPVELDQYSLFLLKHELENANVEQDELDKLFEDYRYKVKSKNGSFNSDLYQLSQAEQTYSKYGTADLNAAPRDPQEKAKDIQQWQDAKKQVESHFVKTCSPFFTLGISQRDLDQKQLPDLSKKWQEWMLDCVKSTERRFVVRAGVKIDPQLRDLQLDVSYGGGTNPYTWEPTKPLIEQGVPADRLLILPPQDELRLINLTPCLQLEQPVEQTLEQVPNEIHDLILKRQNQSASLELIVSIGEPKLLPDSTKKGQDGLLLPAKLLGIRLLDDQKLIYETPLPEAGNGNNVDQTASISKSRPVMPAEKKATPADPEKMERFTPATAMRLMARYLPEFVKENGETLMYNRWIHESDFRKYGEQSLYGLNAERPVYFRSQIKSLPKEQIQAEAPAFVKWLSQPETYPGDRFTVQFSTKFLSYSKVVEGYRRDLIQGRDIDETSNHGKVKSSINAEISLLERSIKAEAFMQQNYPDRPKSGGGGGVGGLSIGTPNNGTTTVKEKSKQKESQPSAKTLQYQKEIEALIRLKHYVEWASPVFYLHQVNKKFGFIELPGKPKQNYSLEHIPPSGDSQPILTVLNLSHEIVMPDTNDFHPLHVEWPVELEFETKAVRAQDTPPAKYNVEEWGQWKERVKLPLDHGKYVVFDVEVKGAWLLDRQTGKRLHQMKLIPVKQMKQVREQQN